LQQELINIILLKLIYLSLISIIYLCSIMHNTLTPLARYFSFFFPKPKTPPSISTAHPPTPQDRISAPNLVTPNLANPPGTAPITMIMTVVFTTLYLQNCTEQGVELNDDEVNKFWDESKTILLKPLTQPNALPFSNLPFIQNFFQHPKIKQCLQDKKLLSTILDKLTEDKKDFPKRLAQNVLETLVRFDFTTGDFDDNKIYNVLKVALSLSSIYVNDSVDLKLSNSKYIKPYVYSLVTFSFFALRTLQNYPYLTTQNDYIKTLISLTLFPSLAYYFLSRNQPQNIAQQKPQILKDTKSLATNFIGSPTKADPRIVAIANFPHEENKGPVISKRRIGKKGKGGTYEYILQFSPLFLPEHITEGPHSQLWHLSTMINCVWDDVAERDIKDPDDAHLILQFQTIDSMYYLFLHALTQLEPQFFSSMKTIITDSPSSDALGSNSFIKTLIDRYLEKKPEYDNFLNHPFFRIRIQPYLDRVLQTCKNDSEKLIKLQNFCNVYKEFLNKITLLPCKFNELDESNLSENIDTIVTTFLNGVDDTYKIMAPDYERFNRYRIISFLLTSLTLSSLEPKNFDLMSFHLTNLSLSQSVDCQEIRNGLISSQNTFPMTHAHYLALYFNKELEPFFSKLTSLPSYDAMESPKNPLSCAIKGFLNDLFTYFNNAKDKYHKTRTSLIGEPDLLKNFSDFQLYDELHHLMATNFRTLLASFTKDNKKAFNKDIERYTNILIKDPKMLKTFFQIFLYLKEMRNIELLEKWFNDLDLLEEISGPAKTIVPVTFFLLGLRSNTKLLIHILELLGITNQDINQNEKIKLKEQLNIISFPHGQNEEDKSALEEYFTRDEIRDRQASFDNFLATDLEGASQHTFPLLHQVNEKLKRLVESEKLRLIEKNLGAVNCVFEKAIELYKTKLTVTYVDTYKDLFETNGVESILNNIFSKLEQVKAMYISFVKKKIESQLKVK